MAVEYSEEGILAVSQLSLRDVRILHVYPPTCIREVLPHMWVTAKVKPGPDLAVVCFSVSGVERKEPILN